MAAAIPSILYYFGIFVQLDAYAGRNKLKGMERSELPTMRATLKEGWQYIFVFAVLIFFMMVRRQETIAPFYATALLLVINQLGPRPDLNSRVETLTQELANLASVTFRVRGRRMNPHDVSISTTSRSSARASARPW